MNQLNIGDLALPAPVYRYWNMYRCYKCEPQLDGKERTIRTGAFVVVMIKGVAVGALGVGVEPQATLSPIR